MEHRVVLTQNEAFELSKKLRFIESGFVRDEYTGEKRFRTDENGVREKGYQTPAKGTICRFTALCEMGEFKNVWFEVKWTKDKVRFEVEFEDQVPDDFKDRKNIPGWDILK